MHALGWILLALSVIALLGFVGWLVYLVGAKAGFSEGWDEGRYALRDDYQYRRDQLDKMYAECKAQRDSAQAELAAAHVARDTALAECDTAYANRDGVREENRRISCRIGEVKSERDAVIAERDRLSAENERLARAHQAFTVDLHQMWHAGRMIAARASSIEERMAGYTLAVGGTAVGDDGPGDEDDEAEDDEVEDEDDMDDEDEECDDIDSDFDDIDDMDTCPDCGEDWIDCECDDEDEEDF